MTFPTRSGYAMKDRDDMPVMKRTHIVAAALAVGVVAAGAVVWFTVGGGDTPSDPRHDYVVSICRNAAAATPALSGEDVKEFTAEQVTHEERSGLLYYRAVGKASKSDGFGGLKTYTFECKAQLATTGQQGEVTDILVI